MPRKRWIAGGAGLATLAMLAMPALGQNDAPESLLPPGFDQNQPGQTEPLPSEPSPTPAPVPRPVVPGAVPSLPGLPGLTEAPEGEAPKDPLDPTLSGQIAETTALPPQARRSLDAIGPLSAENGGLAINAMGRVGGAYAAAMLRSIKGDLVSRWGNILLRRTLLSRTFTPNGVNGARWAAERAALLLRTGQADAARMMVQAVDAPDSNRRLQNVALQVYLATADPAGPCPLMPFLADGLDSAEWQMTRAMCAALAGEQSAANEQIDRAERRSNADRIDVLLAEKVVGASVNGRRAVTIDWDEADRLTLWRFGLGLATGVPPPDTLYERAGRDYQAWRVRAPMLPLATRIAAADTAAAMGALSNSAMVDLYAAAFDDPGTPDDLRTRANTLRAAYVRPSPADRLSAMRTLWGGGEDAVARQAGWVLTARAAARFPVLEDYADDSGDLIAAMLAAGLDRNAARWANVVPDGSLGWALLAVGAPGGNRVISESGVDAFVDDDGSMDQRRSRFLVAGLAGLNRIAADDRQSFERRLGMNLGRATRWSRAIDAAARRGDEGMVAILAAVGMQGRSWAAMTPMHLFHIVGALNAVGLEGEARMIAAEAVAMS